jgi:Transglutaminase-like superfamily
VSRSALSLLGRVPRRLRALRASIHTPADGWLLTRMLVWRVLLPFLKFALTLPRLARLMSAHGQQEGRQAVREQQVIALAHGLYGPSTVAVLNNCLERSLLTYRFLSRAGAMPELVVGLSRGEDVARGHVWVSLDGEPVREPRASLEQFVPVLAFGPAGVTRRLAADSGLALRLAPGRLRG